MKQSSHAEHVDWYQFTCKFAEVDFKKAYELSMSSVVSEAIARVAGEDLYSLMIDKVVGSGSGGIYRYKNRDEFLSGVAVYHGGHEHCLVVLSGSVCQRFQRDESDAFWALIERTHYCCSRIDLASTIWTEQHVDEFVGDAGRDMARMPSMSGTTYYAGSRKSDAFTRVYRYNPPHPRSDSIRVEHEYKGKAAKACALECTRSGIAGIVKNRGMKKGLDMNYIDEEAVRLVVGSNRAKSAERTIYWLGTSVRAACDRLIEEGNVTPDELFDLLIAKRDESVKGV